MREITFPIITKPFIYHLLKKENNVVLLQQVSREHNITVGYEVLIIRTRTKAQILNGIEIFQKGDQYLPSTNQFGTHAWSFYTQERAEKKFIEILNKGNL